MQIWILPILAKRLSCPQFLAQTLPPPSIEHWCTGRCRIRDIFSGRPDCVYIHATSRRRILVRRDLSCFWFGGKKSITLPLPTPENILRNPHVYALGHPWCRLLHMQSMPRTQEGTSGVNGPCIAIHRSVARIITSSRQRGNRKNGALTETDNQRHFFWVPPGPTRPSACPKAAEHCRCYPLSPMNRSNLCLVGWSKERYRPPPPPPFTPQNPRSPIPVLSCIEFLSKRRLSCLTSRRFLVLVSCASTTMHGSNPARQPLES